MQLTDFTTESLAAAIEEQNRWMAEEERRELAAEANRLTAKPMTARQVKRYRKITATLYQVDGDLYTTKRPTCGECGFTVHKDGSCGFCE